MLPAAASLAAATQPPLAAPATPVRLDAFQPIAQPGGGGAGMGQALSNAMDGFGARAAQMQARIQEIATKDVGTGNVPAASEVQPTSALTISGSGAGPVGSPMGLMVDCFNFAIEASLVSRAATQFTSSVSTLMKGQ